MNLRNEILAEHSKRQTDRIASFIAHDPHKFSELMDLFFNGGYRITQRAAWIVSTCVQAHTSLIYPFLDKLISNLKVPNHDSVKRNTLKILQDIEIPEHLLGHTAEICFNFLTKPEEPVAIKVYAMTFFSISARKNRTLERKLKLL